MLDDFAALGDQLGRDILLRSTKLDGSPHFKWTCQLVSASSQALVITQPAGTPINTWKEVWTPNLDATIYFWRGKWYNVVQTWKADGTVRSYYGNIITPACWDGNELHWNDLDLDISVQANGAYRLMDEDEWARNAERLNYSPEVRDEARRAVDELSARIARREFPFDALQGD
jgi:protein associated with RNAse G/E